jgi:hypothetical protein
MSFSPPKSDPFNQPLSNPSSGHRLAEGALNEANVNYMNTSALRQNIVTKK